VDVWVESDVFFGCQLFAQQKEEKVNFELGSLRSSSSSSPAHVHSLRTHTKASGSESPNRNNGWPHADAQRADDRASPPLLRLDVRANPDAVAFHFHTHPGTPISFLPTLSLFSTI
jgi:hypothetical protein